MDNEELKQIKNALGVGSVEFIESYLGGKYHTGKKWLSGEIEVPGPVAQCAKLWLFISNEKLIDKVPKN